MSGSPGNVCFAVGEPARRDEKAGVRHHPMLRARAHPLEMPEAHEIFRNLEAGEASILTQSIDQALDLQDSR